jgi:hypothetical protein
MVTTIAATPTPGETLVVFMTPPWSMLSGDRRLRPGSPTGLNGRCRPDSGRTSSAEPNDDRVTWCGLSPSRVELRAVQHDSDQGRRGPNSKPCADHVSELRGLHAFPNRPVCITAAASVDGRSSDRSSEVAQCRGIWSGCGQIDPAAFVGTYRPRLNAACLPDQS